MTTYLHVFQQPAGDWSGLILQPVAELGPHEHPVDCLIEARERFPDCVDLPRDAKQAPSGHAANIHLPTGGRLLVDAVREGWTWVREGMDGEDLARAEKPFDHFAQALADGLIAAGMAVTK